MQGLSPSRKLVRHPTTACTALYKGGRASWVDAAQLLLPLSCLELPLLRLSPVISCSLLHLQFPLSETASSLAPLHLGESSHTELAALGAEALQPFVPRDPDLHPPSDVRAQSHGWARLCASPSIQACPPLPGKLWPA